MLEQIWTANTKMGAIRTNVLCECVAVVVHLALELPLNGRQHSNNHQRTDVQSSHQPHCHF